MNPGQEINFRHNVVLPVVADLCNNSGSLACHWLLQCVHYPEEG